MKRSIIAGALTVMTAVQATASPQQPGLCVALRGNGFRIASHFGSLAKIVETSGMPDAVVGSSSGSISAFLLDSVALNPWVHQSSPEDKKLEAALLLKTMPEFIIAIFNEGEIKLARKAGGALVGQTAAKFTAPTPASSDETVAVTTAPVPEEEVEEVKKGFDAIALVQKHSFWVKLALNTTTYFKALISPAVFKYMADTNKINKQAKKEDDATKKAELKAVADFRLQQVKDAFGATSTFNVETDTNLFFRPAVINHAGMVTVWDRLASFYAGYNFFQQDKDMFTRWIKHCAPLSAGKTFAELVQSEPSCGSDFEKMAKRYLSQYKNVFGTSALPACSKHPELKPQQCARFRYEDSISIRTNSFIVSSIIVGDAVNTYSAMAAQFPSTSDKNFGTRFKLDFRNFRIGYYGDVQSMNKIKSEISGVVQDSSGRQIDYTNDFKAQRTIPLGNVTWMEALTKSQPKPMKNHLGEAMLSFGGWPDPNPMHILKGLGCETSIAVVTTIKSGNKFGEQVMNKLFSNMTGNPAVNDEVAFGNNDFTSDWGRWRNKKNPRGSETLSFQASEGIYCTQWDELNPFDPAHTIEENMRALADVGYRGSLFIPEDVAGNNPVRSINIPNIQRSDDVYSAQYKRPLYNGCIPPVRPR
ncbi:MAG: hypothetical protein V4736_07680 [Bdellovibrionota bacterium]